MGYSRTAGVWRPYPAVHRSPVKSNVRSAGVAIPGQPRPSSARYVCRFRWHRRWRPVITDYLTRVGGTRLARGVSTERFRSGSPAADDTLASPGGRGVSRGRVGGRPSGERQWVAGAVRTRRVARRRGVAVTDARDRCVPDRLRSASD